MAAPQLMMDAAVQTSIQITAKMFGISPDAVTKILQVSLPAMGKSFQENPEAMKQMFALSVQMMPEDMQKYYTDLAANPEAQAALSENYEEMFGEMTASIDRIAADAAGVDVETASGVISSTLPAVASAAAEDAPKDEDATGFGKRVKGLFG